MERSTILDCERIKALRLANNVSQSELAEMVGASQTIIRYLENGRNHGQLTLRMVSRLAEVLGADLRDIIRRDLTVADAATDDIRVEALLADEGMPLAAQEIAAAFDWPLARARRALQQLKNRLSTGGTSVTKRGGGRWKLGPRHSVLSDEDRARLARARLPRRGITRTEAQILREIAAGAPGTRWSMSPSAGERLALAGLLKLALVVLNDDGAPVIHPSVARSLHLQQEPERQVMESPRRRTKRAAANR